MSANGLKLFGLVAFSAAGAVAISSGISFPIPSASGQTAAVMSGEGRCSALAGRQFGDATVQKVDFLAKGAATSPFGTKAAADICRVSLRISPIADSEIKARVWLPASWNGKIFGVGGGGFNGGLSGDGVSLAQPVNNGYAGVATDAGHDVSDKVNWALGHREKIVDFAHRGNHEGVVAAKAIVAAYYGAPAKHAYFHGCSNGGRDALMLAQRYPRDYDGIIAGAPANSWTALMSAFMRTEQVVRLVPGVDSLGPKLGLVHDAVIKQCDALDGAKDGLIANPASCHFDPAILQCKSGNESTCLSSQEVSAFRDVYAGTRLRNGRVIMPGFAPGSEYAWGGWFTSPKGAAPVMAPEFFRNMVYDDASWSPSAFVLDRDYATAKRRIGPVIDANNADLRPFVSGGGKLLMYHGWDDPAIPAESSVRYYRSVRRKLGAGADAARLFMVPGMAHCAGGNGPNVLDALGTLETWVERGEAPERMTATKFDDDIRGLLNQSAKVLRTGAICAWPKAPYYKGTGSLDDAASFVCR